MEKFRITSYRQGDEHTVSKLVKEVYDEFISYENTFEGNRLFYKWIVPENISERQKDLGTMWLARDGGKLVGVIEIRENNNITLLFVDRLYQKQGIAGMLFKNALEESIRRNRNLDKFFVHASLCSIPVYKKLGFMVSGKARKENGIFYVPMDMDVRRYREKHREINNSSSDINI